MLEWFAAPDQDTNSAVQPHPALAWIPKPLERPHASRQLLGEESLGIVCKIEHGLHAGCGAPDLAPGDAATPLPATVGNRCAKAGERPVGGLAPLLLLLGPPAPPAPENPDPTLLDLSCLLTLCCADGVPEYGLPPGALLAGRMLRRQGGLARQACSSQ
jgi:hypothetical protein